MNRPTFAVVVVLLFVLLPSAASALVCPTDCESTCVGPATGDPGVMCQWDAGGCVPTNCDVYQVGQCPSEECDDICAFPASTCSTVCRSKSFMDCRITTTCSGAGVTTSTCNGSDGWYIAGGNYACCSGADVCADCVDQEYQDYFCNAGTCDFTITSTNTIKNTCSSCDDAESCTLDSCTMGSCINAPVGDGFPCDDASICTPVDECQAGVCTGTSTLDCDDADTCTDDSCDPVLGCQNIDNMTCVCNPGDQRPFWTVAPAERNTGICTDGVEECNVGGTAWVPITAEVLPQEEAPFSVLDADSNTYCDGVDQDCNGTVDFTGYCFPTDISGLIFNADPLGTGLPKDPSSTCTIGVYACDVAGDCIGWIEPVPEVCDGLDNDCDGVIDNGQPEICDGIDNDCDGLVDEQPASTNCGAGETCHWGTCFNDCVTSATCGGMEVCWVDDNRCDDASDPCNAITCPAANTCYQGTCFVSCTADAQCDPANEQCFDGNVCLNDTDPCIGVQCPDTQECYGGSCFDPCDGANPCTNPLSCWDGRCANDVCDGVLCPLGEDCFGGTCFQVCTDDLMCDPGSYCYDGRCAQDNCQYIQCPLGDVCHGGNCFDACTGDAQCSGDTCFDADFCAVDACDGPVECGTSQTCFGGTCFDNCMDASTCDPNEICYDNRCVDETEPYCDGVLCGEDKVCVSGTCFDTCTEDANCDPSSYCYQGACVEDTCTGVTCVTGEVCHRGVCYVECDAANPCVAPDGCFDGRCAASECEAMAVNLITDYNNSHPFREVQRRLVAQQRSTPWIYPRPYQDAGGVDYQTWLGYSGNSTTAPFSAPKRARVVFFLDSNEGGSPGEYVFYLTHGATAGQGAAESIWSVRFDDVNPSVRWMDDPGAEAYHETDSDPRHITAALKTGANETGGMAIGFLPADEEWSIKVHASFQGDIDGWDIINGETGEAYALKVGEPLFINNYDMPDSMQFSPEIGTPCTRTDQGICQSGTYLECKNFESVCYQTVSPFAVEICDGLDNTCNGLTDNADPNLEFPMAYWKQGTRSGYQVLATYDADGPVSSIINYTPDAADDRLGHPNIVLPDGDAIQTSVDEVHLLAYRDLGTGIIYYGWVYGKDGDPAAYMTATGNAYEERNVEMDFDAPVDGDLYNVYVAWYDDRRPGATNDEVLDEFYRDREEVDFRMFQPVRNGRIDSDAVFFGNDWSGTNMGADVRLDDDSGGRRAFEYYLQRPTVGRTALQFDGRGDDRAEIYLRILGKPANDTICESDTATPAGCELSRYACIAGETICQVAVDPACSTCFDLDNDGYPGIDPTACPTGTDCNDEDPNVNPGNAEVCNGIDDNCDGLIDRSNTGCPAGKTECGPQECNFAISCQCPDGAELPETPDRDCFCGAGLQD